MKVTLMQALNAIAENISVQIDSSTNNISVHIDHSSLKGMRKYLKFEKERKKDLKFEKERMKENQKIRDAIEYRNSPIKRAL